MRRKSFYDHRAYTGPDVSIPISLRSYGLIWKTINKRKQEYSFVYGTKVDNAGEYVRFSSALMNKAEWIGLVKENWFHLSAVCCFAGYDSGAAFADDFPYAVQSAISYHGAENIFGVDYSGGYPIGKD